MGESSVNEHYTIELEQHVNRKLWNQAIDLIDEPPPIRRGLCTIPGSMRNTSYNFGVNKSSVLPHIRRAMLRHDWVLARRLLACCFIDQHKSDRDVVHKIMFQILLSSPLCSPKIVKDFCRMFLGTETDEDIETFLKVICMIPDELPFGTTRVARNGKLYIIHGPEPRLADAYMKAVKRMLERTKKSLKVKKQTVQKASKDHE